MIYRQKILMGLAQELGGIPAGKLQPLLFLYCHNFMEHNHYYDFIPTLEGPLSLQAQEDKKNLTSKKLLEKSEDWLPVEGKKRFAVELDFFEKIALQKMKNESVLVRSREELLAWIAEKHPHVRAAPDQPSEDEPVFFTIGYEGLTPEAYLNKLIRNKIRLLCDVRKNAYSQKYGFTKGELQAGLRVAGIAYCHMPQLGIVSEKRQHLDTDADYRALLDEYEATTLATQQKALDELMRLAEQHRRIAITCFEADVSHCHRSRVAGALEQRDDFTIPMKHL